MSPVKQRVGRRGFMGSPITDWCSACKDYVVPMRNGTCGWCDAKVSASQAQLDLNAELARLAAQGLSDRGIGVLLGMDPRKVRRSLKRIEAVAA
jgi:hypothetical protein